MLDICLNSVVIAPSVCFSIWTRMNNNVSLSQKPNPSLHVLFSITSKVWPSSTVYSGQNGLIFFSINVDFSLLFSFWIGVLFYYMLVGGVWERSRGHLVGVRSLLMNGIECICVSVKEAYWWVVWEKLQINRRQHSPHRACSNMVRQLTVRLLHYSVLSITPTALHNSPQTSMQCTALPLTLPNKQCTDWQPPIKLTVNIWH